MTRASVFAGKSALVALLLVLSFGTASLAAQNAAIVADPPPDHDHPATIYTFQLPSHGALLNALVYEAAGAGPHPTVVLLHGFPGNEKNLDVAQAVRRAGWNVLYFDYRGSWGSPGDFSFTHCLEDTGAAVAWLRDPANAARVRTDPKRIVLVGHSMGGFTALEIGARDAGISGVIAISAADMWIAKLEAAPADQRTAFPARLAKSLADEGMAPLAGTSPEALANEVVAHAAEWDFSTLAQGLAMHPLLVITSDDGLRGPAEALAVGTQKAGGQNVDTVHFATDHSYSDHRIALEEAVLDGLAKMQ
jgi:uncharacterized protein